MTRTDCTEAPTEQGTVRVVVVHASELVLLGCRALFGGQDWVERCVVARDLESAATLTSRYEPHVALVQISDIGTAARRALKLRQAHDSVRVAMIAEAGRLTSSDARAAGAQALLDSSMSVHDVLRIVRALAMADQPLRSSPRRAERQIHELSARERQVLWYLATGATNREIGLRLVLSPDTIKNHVSRAYRKLGARNRLEAVNRARDLGLIS